MNDECSTQTAEAKALLLKIVTGLDDLKARADALLDRAKIGPETTDDEEMISEARILVRDYLMEDDVKLTYGAQRLKRALARAVVAAGHKEQER